MRFPTLYSKNADGSLNEWTIESTCVGNFGQITTTYGRVDGAKVTATDTIAEGKNLGKKNATTPWQQAENEARAKWTKQKKAGYVESQADALKGKVDALIQGGVEPMLAKSFAKDAEKIKYPAFVQPKLDGIRCIAVINEGKVSLWSRTRKPITSVPHIVKALEERFAGQTLVLDGELYNHALKADFEQIVSLVRQEKPAPGCEKVQYHIYDMVSKEPFSIRQSNVWHKIAEKDSDKNATLVCVATWAVANEEEAIAHFDVFTEQGYEGAMIRNAAAPYEVGKRSSHLQKIKEFVDDEFAIVGVDEGRGAMAGKAIFVCKTKDGKEFRVKMEGRLDDLAKYLTNKSLWEGKQLTVKYQNLTKDGIPRFPVGKVVRDYE